MKHFTKQIYTILYSMHDLLWVVIGLLLLLGVILIASSDSWLYLLLFLPLLVYIYSQKASDSLKIKSQSLDKNLRRWFLKFISASQKASDSLKIKSQRLEKRLRRWFISTAKKHQIHTLLYSMHDLIWVVIGLLLLLGFILVASTRSWFCLFLFFPVLVYVYSQKVSGSLKIKFGRLEKNIRLWFFKFISSVKRHQVH